MALRERGRLRERSLSMGRARRSKSAWSPQVLGLVSRRFRVSSREFSCECVRIRSHFFGRPPPQVLTLLIAPLFISFLQAGLRTKRFILLMTDQPWFKPISSMHQRSKKRRGMFYLRKNRVLDPQGNLLKDQPCAVSFRMLRQVRGTQPFWD